MDSRVFALFFVSACASPGHAGTSSPEDATARVCPVEPTAVRDGEPAPPPVSPVAGEQSLVFQNARLIDGTGAVPRDGVSVVVVDGQIAAVGETVKTPAGATVIDLLGKTLLPGFIDTHTHLLFDPPRNYAAGVEREVRETPEDAVLRGVANARATLLAGFTTVRNVGGTFGDRALRDAIVAGRVPGPRMLVANYSLGITGGHCDDTNALRPGVFGGEPDYRSGVTDGVDSVRKAVRYQVKHGADVIKICATGGVLSQGDGVGAPQLTPEEMKAIVDEAVRAERKVAAHAHGNQGIKEAVRAGVHSIEHGSVLDREAIRLMKQRGTFLVPTTYVGAVVVEKADAGVLSDHSAQKAREIAPKMRRSFKMAYEAGVKIALGSDAGVFEHGENGKEFTTMVGLGMKPMDAIVAGTSRAAELLARTDIGTVAPGHRADLVVVAGDPLQDVKTLERPVLVMKDGVVYRNDLDGS